MTPSPLRLCLMIGVLAVGGPGGCKARGQPDRSTLEAGSSAELVAAARARSVPLALQAAFAISVKGPTFSGTTRGGMVAHQPDHLRVDIFSPLNTPLAYLASDGRALHLWLQQESTFYRGDDAGAVLDELLGGLGGVEDIIDLLTGTLPLDDAEVLDARYDAGSDRLRVTLQGPRGVHVQAWLEPDQALLQQLRILQPAADGAPEQILVEAEYTDYLRVEGTSLPEDVSVSFPPLGWEIGLKIDTWNALGQVPDVFTLAPPPGAVEKDLVQSLREMAAKRQAQP